jgi:predicted DNA-binding transcriptional regulator AlpA
MMLNERQVAETLGLSVTTLRSWRCREKGPRFHKFGGAVRYDSAEIERFKFQSQHEPSSERAAEGMRRSP